MKVLSKYNFSALTNLLHVLTLIVAIGYPFAVYVGLTYWGKGVLVPLLLTLFILRLALVKDKVRQLGWLMKSSALFGIALTFASWLLQQSDWLLFYPVMMNVLFLGLFGLSLIKGPTLVERLARLSEPDLDAKGILYTRKVTQVWCLFFIINGGIALYTCLSGNIAMWTLYNGAISYMLMGVLMGLEWCIRKHVRNSSA